MSTNLMIHIQITVEVEDEAALVADARQTFPPCGPPANDLQSLVSRRVQLPRIAGVKWLGTETTVAEPDDHLAAGQAKDVFLSPSVQDGRTLSHTTIRSDGPMHYEVYLNEEDGLTAVLVEDDDAAPEEP